MLQYDGRADQIVGDLIKKHTSTGWRQGPQVLLKRCDVANLAAAIQPSA